MDGIYWNGDPYEQGEDTCVFLLKYKRRGWWCSYENDFSLESTILTIKNADREACWSWENRDHEDDQLILPWKTMLEWRS